MPLAGGLVVGGSNPLAPTIPLASDVATAFSRATQTPYPPPYFFTGLSASRIVAHANAAPQGVGVVATGTVTSTRSGEMLTVVIDRPARSTATSGAETEVPGANACQSTFTCTECTRCTSAPVPVT